MNTKTKDKPKAGTRMRVVIEYEVKARDSINIPAAIIHMASGCQPKTGTVVELRKPRVDICFKGADFGAVAKMEADHALMIEKLASIVDHLAKVDPSGDESKKLIDDARGLLGVVSQLRILPPYRA